jgi:hypothetical protein
LIGFEAHTLDTLRAIINGDPSIRRAGVATHGVPYNLQVSLLMQHICNEVHKRNQQCLKTTNEFYFKSVWIS